jgi:transposase
MARRDDLIEFTIKNPEGMVDMYLALELRVARLESIIVNLEARLNKNSRNSSKPSSTDGLKKPNPKSPGRSEGTNRKSGGQLGHQGSTLDIVDNPDHTVVHSVQICPCGCGSDLSGIPPEGYKTRQVHDIPTTAIEVTDHKMELKRCPVSGELVHGHWPQGVTSPVQYGPSILSVIGYFSVQQAMPYKRIAEAVFDLYGRVISQGTVQSAINKIRQHEKNNLFQCNVIILVPSLQYVSHGKYN